MSFISLFFKGKKTFSQTESFVANGIFAIPIKPLEPTATEQLELFEDISATQPENDLQQFIFGRENAAVRQALECVLAQQTIASPLVLYGESGTGKSVLSHTLIAQWFQRYPDQKAMHTTGADFARMHARAVYAHTLNEFRQRFLGVGLLVIDDLQILKTRSSAQQMMCNIIDHYHANDRMLVVCLPELPTHITDFDDRLTSRLMGGLQIGLQPPGKLARSVIVEQLADQHGIKLDEETKASLVKAGDRVVSKVETVPQIRQAMIRLRSEADLQADSLAGTDLQALLDRQQQVKHPDIKSIATAVSKHLNIRLNDMKSSGRRRYVVRARGIAIYLCRLFTTSSFGDIGRYFGKRDHSTVMHASKKIAAALESDASIRLAVEEISAKLAQRYNLEKQN